MTLSIQRSDRRDRRLCRFGVMLVVCSLVINMVAVPKSKAVVIEASAAFGAAATTAAINGTTATTLFTGMGTSAATGSVIGLMDTYAAATGVAASGSALASTIATGILVSGGVLLVGAAAAALIAGFIDWMIDHEGLEPGGKSVFLFDRSAGIYDIYGNFIPVSFDYPNDATPEKYIDVSDGSITFTFEEGSLVFGNPSKLIIGGVLGESVPLYAVNKQLLIITSPGCRLGTATFNGPNSISRRYSEWYLDSSGNRLSVDLFSDMISDSSSFGLHPNSEFQEVPNTVPEGLVLSIDTGLSTLPQNDPQAAADSIMQSAIAGSLAPSVNVAPDPSVQPDPDPEPDPEVPTEAPELPSNIGRLGKALTTRFPFSIPWDIAKAVELLAAPAQAPYWEIDFMRPIAYRFGGLGDTTITIDLGQPEFEIIGITTRLTSTIGFCLALAAATKRFIWTA